MPPLEPHPASFPVTRWTMVVRAGHHDSSTRCRAALEHLCRAYWYPLYAFARHRGLNPPDAEDATQSFFISILEDGLFQKADPGRGRLRSFLLASFTNFLNNLHRAASRQKRGGHIQFVPMDLAWAEGRYTSEPFSESPIEALYQKRWALSLMECAMGELRRSCERVHKAETFEALQCFLSGQDSEGTYATASKTLGISMEACRQEVFRLRGQYRTILREIVADTLDNPTPEDIQAELKELKRALLAGMTPVTSLA